MMLIGSSFRFNGSFAGLMRSCSILDRWVVLWIPWTQSEFEWVRQSTHALSSWPIGKKYEVECFAYSVYGSRSECTVWLAARLHGQIICNVKMLSENQFLL
jgi:hypothetical protein